MSFIEKVSAHHNAFIENGVWTITQDQMVKINSNLAREYAGQFNPSGIMLIKEKDIVSKIKTHIITLENH
jgi:hypothetical protein